MLKSSKATQYLIHWVYAVKRHFDITETVVPPQGDEVSIRKQKTENCAVLNTTAYLIFAVGNESVETPKGR